MLDNSTIAKLTSPITDDNPVGVDCREDGQALVLFYQLKDKRREVRNRERQRMQDGEIQIIVASEWRDVKNLAEQILQTQSKDIEVACYLLEALTRIQGFSGLATGLQLIHQLCQQFSSMLYPLADEDGVASTFAALISLNGEQQPGGLIIPINAIPITPDQHATWQYQEISERKPSSEEQQQEEKLSLSELELSLKQASHEFVTQLLADIDNAQQAATDLTELLENQYHDQAPSIYFISKAITECQQAVLSLKPKENSELENINSEQAKNILAENAAGTKSEIIEKLQHCVDYFKQHEPHSPLSYVLARCVSWSDMDLPELMQDIIKDQNAYFNYCQMVGIPNDDPSDFATANNQPGFSAQANPDQFSSDF